MTQIDKKKREGALNELDDIRGLLYGLIMVGIGIVIVTLPFNEFLKEELSETEMMQNLTWMVAGVVVIVAGFALTIIGYISRTSNAIRKLLE